MVYSSTGSGYMIIPKLNKGDYSFVIGFPKNEWPEQNIKCSVEDKYLGYLLKNFGDKGWGLFNLQSLKLLMAEDSGKKGIAADVRSDAFSNLLSIVVNDSTIKQNEYANEEIKKPAPEIAKVEQQSRVVKPAVELPEAREQPTVAKPVIAVVTTEEQPLMVITAKDTGAQGPETDVIMGQILLEKKLTKKTTDGIEMVYVDTEGGTQDTVKIFIPDKEALATAAENTEAMSNTKDTKSGKPEQLTVAVEEKKSDSKFLEIELPNPNAGTISEVKADSVDKKNMPVSKANADCKSIATNDDFLKLRKKMAAEDSPEDMTAVAKKVFKSKCFGTEQIKNLSVLFLKDASKYDFFYAAYPFVSDPPNFEKLEAQLTDSYYIERFNRMIKY